MVPGISRQLIQVVSDSRSCILTPRLLANIKKVKPAYHSLRECTLVRTSIVRNDVQLYCMAFEMRLKHAGNVLRIPIRIEANKLPQNYNHCRNLAQHKAEAEQQDQTIYITQETPLMHITLPPHGCTKAKASRTRSFALPQRHTRKSNR